MRRLHLFACYYHHTCRSRAAFETPPVTGLMLLIRGIDCLFNEVENSKTIITNIFVKAKVRRRQRVFVVCYTRTAN